MVALGLVCLHLVQQKYMTIITIAIHTIIIIIAKYSFKCIQVDWGFVEAQTSKRN